MKKDNNKMTDTQIIDAVLDTSQAVAEGEEFVTAVIKKVAGNKGFKTKFLKRLNDKKATLTNDDLTTFGKQVHKMQKLIAKVKTQEAICDHLKLDHKETRYTIRIVKEDDITKFKTHTEEQRGQYFEFITDKEPAEAPKPKPLVEVIANWEADNEPDGLAHPDRKAYNNQLLEAKAYLTGKTVGMTVSK